MKSISATFLQYNEGSIPDKIDFLAFTLQSFLADVKPYPVSNLELMINPVFFMLSFILCLTFIQLFPNSLVYLLDPMDEIVGYILCSFFIHIDISPIHQFQRKLW